MGIPAPGSGVGTGGASPGWLRGVPEPRESGVGGVGAAVLRGWGWGRGVRVGGGLWGCPWGTCSSWVAGAMRGGQDGTARGGAGWLGAELLGFK